MVLARSKLALTTAGAILVGSVTTAHAVPMYATPGNPLSGGMQDIDIGSDGDVFAVGTENIAGTNGRIYHWTHGRWFEFFASGYATRVSSDSHGRPWIINSLNEVWRHNGVVWSRVPAVSARAIDIGPSSSGDRVFILRTNGLVALWNGSAFVNFGGSGTEITVDGEGNPWVVNSRNEVWQHKGGAWRMHNRVSARDIDAGADGTVYMLSVGASIVGYLYRYNPSTDSWVYNGGYGTRVAVAPTGAPATVDAWGTVRSNFVRQLHGDFVCNYWEDDCNACAFDVVGQFVTMFDYGHRDNHSHAWTFGWYVRYPPESRQPIDAFEDGTWWPSGSHVQGFVHTRHGIHPYAGTYSDNGAGSLFTVSTTPSLTFIKSALGGDHHPSGLHALGYYVGINEFGRLRIHHLGYLRDPPAEYAVPEPAGLADPAFASSGGGLGLARLIPTAAHPDRYLVASSNPGGDDASLRRRTHFWELADSVTAGTLRYLGGGEHQLPWGQNFHTNENLSLITECETGQIYAVHTGGDYDFFGDGHWRLSRLEQGPSGPVLRALRYFVEGQNGDYCHLRSAATAYTDPDGTIVTYCHERDMRNDLGGGTGAGDFRRRPGDYNSSCIYSCGGTAPTGCWCDALCLGFGDCCSDKTYHCVD